MPKLIRPEASGSQASSAGTSLSTILDLDPSSADFTCVGHASSNKDNRCRRRIHTKDRDLAESLLSTTSSKFGSDQDIQQLLVSLAPHVLCQGYHKGQAQTIAAEWTRQVAAFRDSSQNSPDSSARAFAMRALPSARNNLSSYARMEPSIPSQATQSRLSQRDNDEPPPLIAPPRSNISALSSSRTRSSSRPAQVAEFIRDLSAHVGSSSVLGGPSNPSGNTERNSREISSRSPFFRTTGELSRTSASESPYAIRGSSLLSSSSTSTRRPAEPIRTDSTSSTVPSSGSRLRAAGYRQASTSTPPTNSRTAATPPAQARARQPPSNPAPPPPISRYPSTMPGMPPYLNPPGGNPYSSYPLEKITARRPIKGDCSICYDSLDYAPLPWMNKEGEAIDYDDQLVWCRGECGVNFHKTCFERWRICCFPARVSCPNW